MMEAQKQAGDTSLEHAPSMVLSPRGESGSRAQLGAPASCYYRGRRSSPTATSARLNRQAIREVPPLLEERGEGERCIDRRERHPNPTPNAVIDRATLGPYHAPGVRHRSFARLDRSTDQLARRDRPKQYCTEATAADIDGKGHLIVKGDLEASPEAAPRAVTPGYRARTHPSPPILLPTAPATPGGRAASTGQG